MKAEPATGHVATHIGDRPLNHEGCTASVGMIKKPDSAVLAREIVRVIAGDRKDAGIPRGRFVCERNQPNGVLVDLAREVLINAGIVCHSLAGK